MYIGSRVSVHRIVRSILFRAFGVYRITCKRIAYCGSALCLGCMVYIGLRVSV